MNCPYVDEQKDGARVESGLPSAFVTGWVCGALVLSKKIEKDPMAELLASEGVDLEEVRKDCGEGCDCGMEFFI